MDYDVETIASKFRLEGRLVEGKPFGSGIINDTYSLTCEKGGEAIRYVLQRINHEVFKNPPETMDNIRRVTDHIRGKVQEQDAELAHRQLEVIGTEDGGDYFRDEQGNYWRVYNYVEGAVTYDTLESAEPAYEAARMFGWFQRMLTDLPGPMLYETIVDFHTTPKRLTAFEEVLRRDPCNRAKDAKAEVDFVLENAAVCGVLLDRVAAGEIPVRITHNETVMAGSSKNEFGDMVRTATNPVEEDERDLSKVTMRMGMFEALARGFAEETHTFLTAAEKKLLTAAGKLITFEQMIRFLGDHIAGDTYYKIQREGHNLDRTRTQMKMVQSITEQEEATDCYVEKVFKELS